MSTYQPSLQAGGGSIMVWGAIQGERTVPLFRVTGTLKAPAYTEILNVRLIPWITEAEGLIFQQVNASCHTARLTKNYLQLNDITVMDWPPYSPDLNPIENLWSHLKRELNNTRISGLNNLFATAELLFSSIPSQTVKKLVESMPSRIAQVIKNKGGHTSY